ncbi:MAG: Dam family site-specific DNA-(adenine-N6)-methyltransferase [Candidatus Melainabacteria bacterium]|nr:Dam family site-specific DNA-(adenine-N6)-methyltransferase [Candidatus Melainabacteria bacterium]
MTTVLSREASSPFALADGGFRPPLKWAGGKRWLVPTLREMWAGNEKRRLVEPFCGGLAVVLGLVPEKALLNDINPHAINFYTQLKQGLNIKWEMEYDPDRYYEYRIEFNNLIRKKKANTKRAAELFYYLNRTGYNGLCRFNKQGEYNVPFGTHSKINYVYNFLPYKEIFKDWQFTCNDFQETEINAKDFVYADPPYDVPFTQYSKEGFNWDDQVRLAEWLSKHKGPVVLSNQATEKIVELYSKLGFKLIYRDAPRLINCTGNRAKAVEVIATKRL